MSEHVDLVRAWLTDPSAFSLGELEGNKDHAFSAVVESDAAAYAAAMASSYALEAGEHSRGYGDRGEAVEASRATLATYAVEFWVREHDKN